MGPHASYRGSLTQRLEEASPFVRYDRMTVTWNRWRFDVALESRSSGQPLLRSRSLRYRGSGSEIAIGSYDLRVGQGVTQGASSYHTELHEDGDFAGSFWLPIKNRHNGILIKQDFGRARAGVMASKVAGAEYGKSTLGTYLETGGQKRSAGIVFLRQQLERKAGARSRQDYVAPYFNAVLKDVTLSGESSFGISSAAAHVYTLGIIQERVSQEFTAFSYGRDYHNLQSGGYAYSNYESDTIAETGFVYSEKRSGRAGVLSLTRVKVNPSVDAGLDLVRWSNRIDGRQCVAARMNLAFEHVLRTDLNIAVRTIWEDFNLGQVTDNRRLLTISAGGPRRGTIEWETTVKTERRMRAGKMTYPASASGDVIFRMVRDLAATMTVKYYDPDASVAKGEYLHLAVGQKLTRSKAFSLWIKGQMRYLLDQQRLSGWEARVYCDFAT